MRREDGRIPVAVLGATGRVGSRIVRMLADHPWFRLAEVLASERSAGHQYGNAVRVGESPPPGASGLTVRRVGETIEADLVFSALPSHRAGPVEVEYAERGHMVVSNASAHRLDDGVPLLVPEVNPDHLAAIRRRPSGGAIVTNPNCSTIGLALSLAPLERAFGLEAVRVVTLQAASGAGHPGVSSLDLIDNVIPFVEDEEEKIERETRRIFGRADSEGHVRPADLALSAQCTRVPVLDGHTKCVAVSLAEDPGEQRVREAWGAFRGPPQELGLPTAPDPPVLYRERRDHPQPRLHRDAAGGMAVSVGRLRPCRLLDYRFVSVSHNTVRGAAGGALLCAEMIVASSRVELSVDLDQTGGRG